MLDNSLDSPEGKVLAENEKFHDKFAKIHNRSVPYISSPRTRQFIWDLITEQLMKRGVDPKGAKVLELGCGSGTFVPLFQKLGCDSYTGVDVSGKLLAVARKEHESGNVQFVKTSLTEFAARTQKKYDVIVSSSFLHHLADLDKGLREILDLLSKGGIFVGLHEVMQGRELGAIERLDNNLALLYGYSGFIRFSFPERVVRVFPFFSRIHPIQAIKKFFRKYILTKRDNPERVFYHFLRVIPLLKIKRCPGGKQYLLFGFIPVGSKSVTEAEVKNDDAENTSPATMVEGTETASTPDDGLNYVDYQLNFNFDLSKNEFLLEHGEAIPYCYYNFIWFRMFDKTPNHVMAVMTK